MKKRHSEGQTHWIFHLSFCLLELAEVGIGSQGLRALLRYNCLSPRMHETKEVWGTPADHTVNTRRRTGVGT